MSWLHRFSKANQDELMIVAPVGLAVAAIMVASADLLLRWV